MKMPFGKHKDKELTKIPKTYLRWLHKQDWLQGSLAAAVAEVLGEKASDNGSIRQPWRPSEGEPLPW